MCEAAWRIAELFVVLVLCTIAAGLGAFGLGIAVRVAWFLMRAGWGMST